jgi:small-conductance mechanosensitive channel
MLGYAANVAVWTIILVAVLDNLGFDVTTLVTGLGIGGIAIALAVQNILGDIFAALAIVLDKPFVVGDFIVVDDFAGTVEQIGLKTTRLRSLSGEQIIFANAELLKGRIRNYKRLYERRNVFAIDVTYDSPTDVVARIPGMLREIVEAQRPVRFDRSHFSAYTDSALRFETVYFVLDPDYNKHMDIQQAIFLAVLERFRQEGIDFAFPTRVIVHKHEGEQPAEEASA